MMAWWVSFLLLAAASADGDSPRPLETVPRIDLSRYSGTWYEIAAFPQRCLRADRLSSYRQWELSLADALRAETEGGIAVLAEAREGAARFASGKGRHGKVE